MDNETLMFKLSADTKDLDQALNDVGTKFSNLSKKVALTNASLQKNVSSLIVTKGMNKDVLSAMGVDTTKLGVVGQAGNKWLSTIKQLAPAYNEFLGAVNDVKSSTTFQKMTSGLGATKSQLDKVAISAVAFNKEWTTGIEKMNKLSSSLWVTSMGMQQLGNSLTFGLTLPIGLAGVAIAKFSSDFSAGMSQIQSAAGGGETFKNTLGDYIKSISMNMPETIKNLQDFSYAAAQAGVADAAIGDENKAKAIANYSIVMAQLAGVEKDYKGTAKDLADMMGKVSYSFGLTSNQASNVGSALRFASKNITGGLEEMQSALVRSSGSAALFNISLSDTLGMLMTILPATGSASRAGTQFGQIFQSMSVKYKEVARQMGMDSTSMKDQMNSDIKDVFINYVKYLSGVEGQGVEIIGMLNSVFGKDTSKIVEQFIKNADKLDANMAGVNDAFDKGVLLQQDYETATNNIASQFQVLKNTAQVLMVTIGEDLSGAFQKIIDIATRAVAGMISIWQALTPGVKNMITLVAFFAALLGPTILLFKTLFIDPLAGIVTITAKLGKLIINTGLLATRAIAAGIAQAGLATATRAEAAAATQAAAATTAQAGATLGLQAVSGTILPMLAKLAVAIAAIAAVLGVVYLAYQKNIFGFKDWANKTFNVDKFKDNYNSIKDVVTGKGIVDAVNESQNEIQEAMGSGGSKMVKIAGGWGSKIISAYTAKFSEIDTDVFKKGTDILQQVFTEQEKLGEISGEQMYALGKTGRELLAKAIMEAKKLGNVVSSTKEKLSDLIGGARVGSIIDSIKAAIKVDELQYILDKYKNDLEQLQKTSEKAINSLEKKIKVQEKADKKEEKVYEDEIKALEKRISTAEKAQKAELKVYEDQLKVDENYLELAEDSLKAKKAADDAVIKVLKNEKKTQESNLKSAQKQLTALEKLRDKYTTIAEGLVNYYSNNLSAAEREVELQKTLGKDEFDMSYRLAQEKAKIANDQVTLAEEQLSIVEKAGATTADAVDNASQALKNYVENQASSVNAQISAYEAEIDTLQTSIDAMQENIDAKQAIYDSEEALLQTSVDNLQAAVDADNDAIDAINEKWDAIIEPLQTLVDDKQERLSEIQDAHQAYLDTLTEEKDALKEKYDTEIEIEQAKVDAAQASLDAAKDSLDKINKINAELLAAEEERIGAETGGDSGGGFVMKDTPEDKKDNIINPPEVNIGAFNKVAETITKYTEEWRTSLGNFFYEKFEASGLFESLEYLKTTWNEKWAEFKKKFDEDWPSFSTGWSIGWANMKETVSIAVHGIGTILAGIIEALIGTATAIIAIKNRDWSAAWDSLKTAVHGAGDVVKGTLETVAAPALAAFSETTQREIAKATLAQQGYQNITEEQVTSAMKSYDVMGRKIYGVSDDITKNISGMGTNTSESVSNMGESFGKTVEGMDTEWWKAGKGIKGTSSDVKTDSSKTAVEMTGIGSDFLTNLNTGIKNNQSDLEKSIAKIQVGMTDPINGDNGPVKNSSNWGKDFIGNITQGLKNGWDDFKKWIEKMKNKMGEVHQSYNPELPAKDWGKHFVQNMSDGISSAMPELSDSIDLIMKNMSNVSDINMPIINTAASASSSMAASDSRTTKKEASNVVTQNSGNTYNIQPGTMIASQGEIREFVRLLNKYQTAEAARKI